MDRSLAGEAERFGPLPSNVTDPEPADGARFEFLMPGCHIVTPGLRKPNPLLLGGATQKAFGSRSSPEMLL